MLGWSVLMWAAVGVGVMVKGPVTPMVVGLTAVGYGVASRDWRWMRGLRPVLGLAIVAAMVGPWVWAVAERQGGLGPYLDIVYKEVIGRSGEAQEGHWGPPGYHLVFMLVLFWPGCMMAGLGLWRAWGRVWRVRRDRGDRRPDREGGRLQRDPRPGRPPLRLGFLLAWLVPSWVVFELVMTKLPHYTMPMYPALALLSARGLFAAESARRSGRFPRFVSLLVYGWFGMAAVVVVAFAYLCLQTQRAGIAVAVLCVAAVGILVVLAQQQRRGGLVAMQLASVALAATVWGGALGGLLPNLRRVWVSEPAMRLVRTADPSLDRPLAAVEFHEDSLVFASRGRVARINPDDIALWIREHPTGIVILRGRYFYEHEDVLSKLGVVEGFNYSRGEGVKLFVAEVKR